METLETLLFILQVLVALALIAIILIQHGKGADAGAAFGSGSSSTVFGSQGSGGFITKLTTVLAIVFLANSMALSYIASQKIKDAPTSIFEQAEIVEKQDIPIQQNTDPSIPVVPDK